MATGNGLRVCLVMLAIASCPFLAQAGEIGMDIFGVSYHPDRVDSDGTRFREFNPGLGVNYIIRQTQKTSLFANAGLFSNSYGTLAEYGGVTYQYRLGRRAAMGLAVAFMHSSSYNNGRPFVAPLPVISYRPVNMLSFHVLYAPRFKETNENSVFALFATWHFGSAAEQD